MISTSSDNLSRDKIQQLLAAVGSGSTDNSANIDAVEYNWHEPHYFTREQLNKLDEFTKRISKTIAAKFAALCPGDFNVSVDSVTQHFADKIQDEACDSSRNDYYLAFGNSPDNPVGLIGVPAPTAFAWVTQLLGDTGREKDTNRDLSQLEESLLRDAASAIVETLAAAHPACTFQPGKAIVRRMLPLDLQGTEELCRISFTFEKNASDKTEAYLLILCEALESILSRAAQSMSDFSAEDISRALVEHLEQMSVCVTAQLASAELTLKDLMSLGPCDILLLGRRTNEPIQLIVEGRPIFQGQPAKSGGRYAVVISKVQEQITPTAEKAGKPRNVSHKASPNRNA